MFNTCKIFSGPVNPSTFAQPLALMTVVAVKNMCQILFRQSKNTIFESNNVKEIC